MESPDSASDVPLRIAHIGDFSVSNWGDQLYPGVLTSLLESAGIPARTSCFAPLEGKTSDGQPIRSLRQVRSSNSDVVFLGGGDLVRFDTRTVAMDHMSVPTRHRGSRLTKLQARWFARRHFLRGPGVWVPQDRWLEQGPSVLLSVGVHTVPDTPAAHAAVAQYRAAWVRTHNGADRLSRAGIPKERIIVAPDMVFALPELQHSEATRARGEAIFQERLGLAAPPLIFQAAEFHGWPVDRVSRALATLKGIPTATLALGSYSGEDGVLRTAAERNGMPSLSDLRADEITAVLAAAGTVFTTSMHAAIVGASFGTPVIVPGVGKTNDAFAVCPEPPKLHPAEDSTLRQTAESLTGQREPHSAEANREAVIKAFEATLRAADLR